MLVESWANGDIMVYMSVAGYKMYFLKAIETINEIISLFVVLAGCSSNNEGEGKRTLVVSTWGLSEDVLEEDVDDDTLFPWIGFVFTAPQYRGNRYSGNDMNVYLILRPGVPAA